MSKREHAPPKALRFTAKEVREVVAALTGWLDWSGRADSVTTGRLLAKFHAIDRRFPEK